MAIEILYKSAGLKGAEIGEMMELDYNSASQERIRLKEGLERG